MTTPNMPDFRGLAEFFDGCSENDTRAMMSAKFLAEKHGEAAAALRLAAEMVEWQPISTAPKDGTHFLAYEDGGYYRSYVVEVGDDGNCIYARITGDYPSSSAEPTHWRPLPLPPAPGQAQQQEGEG